VDDLSSSVEPEALNLPAPSFTHSQIKHIVISVLGSAGDLFPLFEIGRVLQGRGYRITVLTSPYYEKHVADAGLEFVPLGTVEKAKAIIDDPRTFGPEGPKMLVRAVANYLPDSYEAIERIASQSIPGTILILANRVVAGAWIARERLGLPLVVDEPSAAALWSATSPPVLVDLPVLPKLPPVARRLVFWLVDRLITDPLLAPEFNRIRKQLGLKGYVHRVLTGFLHSAELALGLFPEWFTAAQPDWPHNMKLTGFIFHELAANLPPGVESFLDRGPKPVVFTGGSANQHVGEFFRESLKASGIGGFRAVFLGPMDKMPTGMPDTIFATDWAPLGPLFEKSLALVQPAGIGTAAIAMRAGLPQLLFPLTNAQPDDAARLVRLGVARQIDPKNYRGEAVAEEINALVADPNIQATCASVRERILEERPGQEVAADYIVALIDRLEISGETRGQTGTVPNS
jgi:rhamnosyltransferase subunit B